MSRFADPTRCPDCGTPLAPGSALCDSCGIDLSGPVGRELFATLVHADTLLGRLRAAARQPVLSGAAPLTPGPGSALPPMPRPTAAPEAMRPSRAPQLLLGLGALCLVVAAMVFLAVTWSRLGVGGRTAVLVLLTCAAAGATAWSLRRQLRASAEALGAVAAGLLVLDLLGARSSGWLGSPDDATFVTWIGAVLAAVGLATAVAATRTATRRLTVGESLVVLGALLLAGGVASLSSGTTELRMLLAVLAALALLGATALTGVLYRRTSLQVALVGTTVVAAGTWCMFVLVGLDHLGTAPSVGSVLGDAEGWPLLAAAALAGAAALLRVLPVEGRVLCGGAGVVVLTLAVTAPAFDEPPTPATLAAVATLLAASLLVVVVPRPWGATAIGAALLAALVTGFEALVLASFALTSVADTALPIWHGTTGGRTAGTSGVEVGADYGSPWLLPVTLAALVLAGWAGSTLLRSTMKARTGLVSGAAAVGVGSVGALVLASAPVAVPLGLLLVAGCAGVAASLVGPDRSRSRSRSRSRGNVAAPSWGALAFLAALPLALSDKVLTLVTLVVLAAAATALRLAHPRAAVVAVAGAALPVVVAALVWTIGELAGQSGGPVALVGIVALALIALAQGMARLSHPADAALDLSALASAVVLAAAGLDAEGGSPDWLAGYLFAAGVATSLLALVRRDRRPVGWLGGALLAAASWVRLADDGVEVVEAYTLPSAVALLVVGALRLRQDATVSTYRTLGAGLGAALVPSLLVALEEPVSLRALLLGAACLVLVVVGAVRRWAAPLTWGTVVAVLLVIREAAPYLGTAVPRWAVIGAAGTLLVVLGMTWEQRLRQARAVAGYVRGLR